MPFEVLLFCLSVAYLIHKLLYRLAETLLTTTTQRGRMSSGGAVLAATGNTSSAQNILKPNNNSNSSASKAAADNKPKNVVVANGKEPTPPPAVDVAEKAHKLNGHDIQNGLNGGGGDDSVDRAPARPAGGDLKLSESEKTETTNEDKSKSKDAAIVHENGINNKSLTVPAAATDGGDVSRSDSRTSCNSLTGSPNNNQENIDDSGNALAADSQVAPSSLPTATSSSTACTAATNSDTLKKKQRLSSGRQQTKKAKRVRFFRNGDKFYPGLVIPVSNERYRSFESLTEDLTRVLGESIKVPGAVRMIWTVEGKKVATLEDLEDGKCYVCSCNNEAFKKIDYSQNNKLNNRLSRCVLDLLCSQLASLLITSSSFQGLSTELTAQERCLSDGQQRSLIRSWQRRPAECDSEPVRT